MQVKIIIGTIAFMLTMIIMGFAALREPARMAEYTHIREGRQIEVGAKIYKDQCATCHGDEGRAENLYRCGRQSDWLPGHPPELWSAALWRYLHPYANNGLGRH
jgi:mono/diheme cytochrome c family protein